MTDLSAKTILVTGGGRGLGRAMARALAACGARLVLTGATASDALAQTVRDCTEAGAAQVRTCLFDVSDAAACQRAAEDLGPVDVLVNNAGRGMRLISETFNTVPTRFWESDPAAWAQVIDTNVNGPFYMARALVPGMVARGQGKVINISTSDQTMVRRGYAPYGPSKAALEAASRVWAQDLAGTGVTVNVFLPGGAADTDLLPPAPDKKGADGKLLSPQVMARGIVWLCSPASDAVTGGRFIAAQWGAGPGPDAAAVSPPVDKPRIM
ncbi:SDR family NAD(P)-dependent oxidoreductase [Salipiger marinus]|uniref:SDR family NAD(P)-dependent oxidoreductase n=1 Tax=Salipiger marinus TaxID=555512 RepID=UPI001E554CD3|nr:SDR family oxidoreductase [Salipiger manganoxidans]MCD1618874.1 SDR family oxidoreductase [Salipiger manganoxidans]MEB3419785.1 SDR family oxidoreductase [Salipiger manganoxidans]